ncbi:MAG: undecaprenyldiphospho-muramoylpentapeptide beta-N-acetylglucosaminyltransferase [Bacilli bacterium]|nr:undecaprenyldiphospho-muramoylpentapeptide beta-N-acetylglucosaminyltransferase [Bacilli bacterium]
MRVIISAGGTGGHIYPALAIINKIKENEPNSEFLYIGTHNRMEKDIIPKYNIKYQPITIIGFDRKKPFKNIKTIQYFFKAIKELKTIIKDFNPDVVIGVGGYVTAPVIYTAKKLGYKTIIHEQNSDLGMSNRFLIKYSDVIATSFESTINDISKKDKVFFTGNPCSEEAINIKKDDKTKLGFHKTKKLVIIMMGSLGSKTINNKMREILPLFNNKDYEILFVTGKDYYEEFKDLKLSSNVKVFSYIDGIKSIMKASDLIVSRAGATTISEIVALNIPTIFIPSPYVTSNHQYKNAMDLVAKDAALLLEEEDLDNKLLIKMIDNTLENETKYNKLKNNLSNLIIKDSSTKIYKLIKELADRRK